MGKWITLLDITDLYGALAAGTITISKMAQTIAERLEQNSYADQLTDVIRMFRAATTTRDVDAALQELWDFADVDRRIFVKVEEEKHPSFLN